MSNQEELKDIAAQAELDLNSDRAKFGRQEGTGHGKKDTKGGSTSTDESGIDESAATKFAAHGATAAYGADASISGGGDNRIIPESEGGDVQKGTGKMTKAGDFDKGAPGEGPEDVQKRYEGEQGGNDDVRGNVRN